jgi:DisA bacterial checkpoint controller nucleotide-binding
MSTEPESARPALDTLYHEDPCHALPVRPRAAIRYSSALTSVRSFHRLCDGLQTLALVDRDGVLVDLVDVREWAQPYAAMPLPVPTIERYRPHSRATLCGGHVCLVLTGNGEIKIFAGGTQVFRFLDGRWRLTEGRDKYEAWQRAIGDARVAERLFVAALELAEDRRGALFVMLDEAASPERLIVPQDLLTTDPIVTPESNQQFHYLLRDRRLLDIAPGVLESVARIDGAIVLDRAGNLLAFGTILRHSGAADAGFVVAEGGRMMAALDASRLGNVLMVSEDGVVSFFRASRCVWQL